ncbi:hypothetical protein [Nonomuraea rubra]|uniref:hypothetical protein n=1 Tax=Nonomuraea rubra TaxID=46180 RepID=UPI003CD0640D
MPNTGTQTWPAHVRRADIVWRRPGWPELITKDMVKPGARPVLDVGVSRVNGKIAGDVGAGRGGGSPGTSRRTAAGSGPMTRALLLSNVVRPP